MSTLYEQSLEKRVEVVERRALSNAKTSVELAKACSAHAAFTEKLTITVSELTRIVDKLTDRVESLLSAQQRGGE
jgi:uncharacterized coiled-coil protein SlyX